MAKGRDHIESKKHFTRSPDKSTESLSVSRNTRQGPVATCHENATELRSHNRRRRDSCTWFKMGYSWRSYQTLLIEKYVHVSATTWIQIAADAPVTRRHLFPRSRSTCQPREFEHSCEKVDLSKRWKRLLSCTSTYPRTNRTMLFATVLLPISMSISINFGEEWYVTCRTEYSALFIL